jgi:hypothetical protein
MTSLSRFLALCLAAWLAAAAPSSAQVELRLKYKPGEVVKMTVSQAMNSTAMVQGQNVGTTMTQTMHLETHVDGVGTDGVAAVRQKIARIEMSMTMPAPINQTFAYDSAAAENPNPPPGYADFMKVMVGSEFKMKISPTGKMTDVEVPESLTQAMTNLPGAAALGNMATSDGLKKMMSQNSFHLPEGPVKVGDTWSNKSSIELPFGTMDALQTYTYRGTNSAGLHAIDIAMDMTITPKAGQAIQMTLKDAKSKGAMQFDQALGQIATSEITQDMKMEMSIGGQKIDQTVLQTIKMDLVK